MKICWKTDFTLLNLGCSLVSCSFISQVQELFECNVRLTGLDSASSASQSLVREATEICDTSAAAADASDVTSGQNESEAARGGDATPSTNEQSASAEGGESTAKSNSGNLSDNSDLSTEGEDTTAKETDTAAAEGGEVKAGGRKSGGRGESRTAALLAGNRKAKDLCQTTCRLLKEQIMKVHEDLDRQWCVLRDAGVIL